MTLLPLRLTSRPKRAAKAAKREESAYHSNADAKVGLIARLFCVALRGILGSFRLSKWGGWLLYTNYIYLYRQAEWDGLPTQPAGPQQTGQVRM
jgi:hypothetical protein